MRNPVRVLAATAAATGLALLAGPAFAHVTVNPGEAPQGGYAKLTFRVPTESDSASTTKVQVALPAEIASARVKPHPGWSYALTRSGDAITAITWTARPGAATKPGEFDEFDISVGPLPKADQVAFKAVQTYSDGSVVRWIEVPQQGQPEPEHPAPVLTLTPASGEEPDTVGTTRVSDDSDTPLVISVVALVVALVGAGAGIGALVNRRRA